VSRLGKILLPLLLLAASLAGAGYLRATKPAVEPEPAIERSYPVATIAALARDHRPTLELFGDVVAGREVVLRPLVAGKVVEASPALVEGGLIEAGDVVVRIDPFEAENALAQLEAERREAAARLRELDTNLDSERSMLGFDREEFDLARRDLERREKLRDSPAASEKALDDARMVLAQRRAAVRQRLQTLRLLEARVAQQEAVIERLDVAVGRAKNDLENVVLTAPFAGFVTEVGASAGKMVGVGDPVARLIDRGRLEIRFQLDDTDFGRLWQDGLIGRPVDAIWRLGGTTFPVEGEVARVEPTIDPASGGVTVFALITANPDGAPLRPGAFVEIEIPDVGYERVVELPASALYAGDTVYAVGGERLQAREVELVAARGERVWVRGDIADGDVIATSRLAEAGPGLKVTVRE
jgi:multidrug efflux system membrane fusion protein